MFCDQMAFFLYICIYIYTRINGDTDVTTSNTECQSCPGLFLERQNWLRSVDQQENCQSKVYPAERLVCGFEHVATSCESRGLINKEGALKWSL